MRGLVLEGGGMRGVFTAGVLDAFLDLNIEFDHCVAISAGALNGISYLSKQRGRNLRVTTNYQSVSIKNWITNGSIFDMDMLLDTIPEKLDPVDHETYKQNPCKLYAGIFDIESGELEFPCIEDSKRDRLYLQAAASLPLLSKIVHINGHKYLDGGIKDCFGLDFALEKGCDQIIVVNTRDKDYRRGEEKTLPLMKLVYRKYPKLIEYIEKRANNYNTMVDRLEKMNDNHEIMLVRPINKVTVSRTEKDKEKLLALYNEGYHLVMNKKEEILAYLQ